MAGTAKRREISRSVRLFELVVIGRQMANVCCNVGQEGSMMSASTREIMRDLQAKWDAKRNEIKFVFAKKKKTRRNLGTKKDKQ